MGQWRRLGGASAALATVIVVGTLGYIALGFAPLDALYQTVTTVTTVGFGEVEPLDGVGQVFTIALILAGVGSAAYAFSVVMETLIEGQLNQVLGRRRMERSIASMAGHVVICGWGRVGRSIADQVVEAGRSLVVVEQDADLLVEVGHPAVVGDATEDDVLRRAGVDRAAALVAAVDSDAENSFIALSARSMRPDLFIVARGRSPEAEAKLRRAGADRVVNPQSIGGARMAAFVLRPHVAEFVDVVMHEGNLEFCLEEVEVPEGSPVAGASLRDSHVRDRTGALVLALRDPDGTFRSNPAPEVEIRAGHVIIAIGTRAELKALVGLVR